MDAPRSPHDAAGRDRLGHISTVILKVLAELGPCSIRALTRAVEEALGIRLDERTCALVTQAERDLERGGAVVRDRAVCPQQIWLKGAVALTGGGIVRR